MISIIIPAHNEEAYLERTLHSIKNQTSSDYEIIVVLNGCTDKTAEVVEKFEDVKILSLSEANVSRARNYGAGKAKGEILLFLDADTLLGKDTLEKVSADFSSKYSVGFTKAIADSEELKYKLFINFKNFYIKDIYPTSSGALICHKEQFDKVNGYDSEINVREHRKLISQLKAYGEHICLDTTVTTSMRRFEKWGLSKAALFWISQLFKETFGDLKKSEYEKVR